MLLLNEKGDVASKPSMKRGMEIFSDLSSSHVYLHEDSYYSQMLWSGKRNIFFLHSSPPSPSPSIPNISIVTCECHMKNVNVMSFALLLYMDIFL